jgi:C4-dicarboxylate-specific signal transduction histidine kinase
MSNVSHAPELRVPDRKTIEETARLAELGKNAQVVFHDLSNHLTALTLTMENLRACLVRDGQKLLEYSRRSDETSEKMQYVARILKSHLSKNDHCAQPTHFSVKKEICTTLSIFEKKAAQENIHLKSSVPDNIVLQGSASGFSQIIANLVTNAIDSLAENPARQKRVVYIGATEHADHIRICARDTGPGIPKHIQRRMFAEGFSTKKTGHGIGLAAVKEIVEKDFGGTVRVKSSPANTIFVVTFPTKS